MASPVFSLIFIAIYALILWGLSELPLMLKEIAQNSRHEGQGGPEYKGADILSFIFKGLAVFVALSGIFSVINGGMHIINLFGI